MSIALLACMMAANCPICTEPIREHTVLNVRCCSMQICQECMQSYCTEQMKEGIFSISCPFTGCDKKLDHGMVMNNLTQETHKKLFEKMIVESTSNPRIKTCPSCSRAEEISADNLAIINKAKNAWFSSANSKTLQIKCTSCSLKWCFSCHAPWHNGMTCSVYLKGDKAFGDWMRWKLGPTVNAHFCPKCRIPIQRSSGCPSMVCCKCRERWCYNCGQSRYWDNTLFGPHYSRIALKGCLAPSYLFCNSLAITYIIRIGFLLSVLAGMVTILVIGILILPLILIGMCTTLPLYKLMLRKWAYNRHKRRVTPTNRVNLKSSVSLLLRLGVLTLVISLFILLFPLIILTSVTVVPLLYYMILLKRRKELDS